MKTKLFCFWFLVSGFSPLLWRGAGGEALAQQDPQYSMYMFNPLALNPAYAGSRDVLATTLLYRDQWTGMDGAPATASFSLHMPVKKNRIGIGAEFLSDNIGPKKTNAFLVSYAYRFRFLKGKLSLGLRTGIFNYAYDWNKMDVKDKNDVYLANGNRTSKMAGTADFGFYYYTRSFYMGFCADHMTHGTITDVGKSDSTTQATHFFIPVGKAFDLGNVVLSPSLLIKAAANVPAAFDLNFNVLLKERWWVGLSFRSGYGIVFLTQYRLSEKMKAGYSYDYGTSKIGAAGGGSHEIMIGYDINFSGAKIAMPRFL